MLALAGADTEIIGCSEADLAGALQAAARAAGYRCPRRDLPHEPATGVIP
jgi:hypothetical protein